MNHISVTELESFINNLAKNSKQKGTYPIETYQWFVDNKAKFDKNSTLKLVDFITSSFDDTHSSPSLIFKNSQLLQHLNTINFPYFKEAISTFQHRISFVILMERKSTFWVLSVQILTELCHL